MAQHRINAYIISAALLTAAIATITIGVLGIITNIFVESHSFIDRMISSNAALISLSVGIAIISLLLKSRKAQLAASMVVLIGALHSLLVSTNLNNILFMPWLGEIEATIYPSMSVIFIILATTLALDYCHPVQRLWLRATASFLAVIGILAIIAHSFDSGFMWLGPHPDITGMAATLITTIGLAYLSLAIYTPTTIEIPSRPAVTLGFAAVFFTCSTWFYLGYSSLHDIREEALRELDRIGAARASMAIVNIQLLERMVERWEVAANNHQPVNREADVEAYLRDIPHLVSLTALDQNYMALWRRTRPIITSINLDFMREQEVQDWIVAPHNETRIFIPEAAFVNSPNSAVALMLLPLANQVKDVRYLLAVLDMTLMMSPTTRLTNEKIKIYTRLTDRAERSFEINKPSHSNEMLLASTPLDIPHGPQVTLAATLYDFATLLRDANMRSAIMAMGLLFSFLFILMFEQNRTLWHHSQRIALSQRRIRKQRRELALNEQRYRSLFSHHPDPVFSLDTSGNFTHVNDAFCEQVGVEREQALAMHFKDLLDTAEFERVAAIFAQVIQTRTSARYDAEVTTLTGERKVFNITNLPIIIEQEVTGSFGIGKDITMVKRQAEELAYQANHDGLTGLYNRSAFERQLSQWVTQKHQGDLPDLLAVIFVDLDGFKPVNESLGLVMGDHILQQVSARLQQQVRRPNLLARFGSDEFVIAIIDHQFESQVEGLVQQLMASIDQPYVIGEHNIYLTASIGITIYNHHAKDAVTLIQQADIAMTEAKNQGRNHYQFYTNLRNSMSQVDILRRSQLQQAIDNENLQLYYQPIIHLQTGKLISVEALMRWILPDGTHVSPLDFIPLAETTGQIIPAGSWALRQACEDMRVMYQHGVPKVAVNLSALQFHRANFYEQIVTILEQTETPANRLEIELTESILMQNTAKAIQVLERLREHGIGVAIDDFGTGFSSLSYLKILPVNKVKIDRAFIKDLPESATDRVIVQGIIHMAEQVGLDVVAEGVESSAHSQLLQQFGCSFAQGYYYAKPMPMAELIPFIKEKGLV